MTNHDETDQTEKTRKKLEDEESNSLLWDCGSSLYDSFELKSFERQLDSVLSSRSYSMPRLTKPSLLSPPPPPPPSTTSTLSSSSSSKKSSRISRSVNKFLRSFFRPRNSSTVKFGDSMGYRQGDIVALRDRFGTLSVIPEMHDMGVDYVGILPEFESLVTRSSSARFTSTSMGISCA